MEERLPVGLSNPNMSEERRATFPNSTADTRIYQNQFSPPRVDRSSFVSPYAPQISVGLDERPSRQQIHDEAPSVDTTQVVMHFEEDSTVHSYVALTNPSTTQSPQLQDYQAAAEQALASDFRDSAELDQSFQHIESQSIPYTRSDDNSQTDSSNQQRTSNEPCVVPAILRDLPHEE